MEYKPVARKKGEWKANSPEAKEFKAWLLANHKQIEAEHGLPIGTLVTISGHESKFDPLAKSWSGATGAFQLITDTARGYGLRVDSEVDERLDYKKATVAAAKYLKENLKKYNGNFAHAAAQWNGGNRVAKEYASGVDPRQIKSPNGTVGEIYKFLNGIKNTGEQYGFKDLVAGINTSFQASDQKINENIKQTSVANPRPTLESFEKKNSIINYEQSRRIALSENYQKPIPLSKSSFLASKETNENPSFQNKSNGVGFLAEVIELAPSLFQVYKSGGRIIQYSGDGKTVEAILKGKERIYSRGDTKRLMELAKKAKTNDDYFLLGKFLVDATKKQDSRPPEYVDA
jgi:hypothetical protein